jgi:hypothetical protein
VSQPILNDRPRPLVDAASEVTRWVGLAGSLLTALAGWGIVTAAQNDAVTGLLGTIPGAVTAATSVLVAFGVVRRGEPSVTPVSDPRNDLGEPLRVAA